MADCSNCDGTGQVCSTCGDTAAECSCEEGQELIVECDDCDGSGEVEDEDEDE